MNAFSINGNFCVYVKVSVDYLNHEVRCMKRGCVCVSHQKIPRLNRSFFFFFYFYYTDISLAQLKSAYLFSLSRMHREQVSLVLLLESSVKISKWFTIIQKRQKGRCSWIDVRCLSIIHLSYDTKFDFSFAMTDAYHATHLFDIEQRKREKEKKRKREKEKRAKEQRAKEH